MIMDEAYHTIGRISGNPVVYEAGDHQEALLDSRGNLVSFGAGVLHWTPVIAMAVKHIIKEYNENPGIFEGDQFLQNNPYIGAAHAKDIQILAPVFWKGKAVAWVACASHHTDVGGMVPGGSCQQATEICQEGLHFPGIKLVEKGMIRKDVEDLVRSMSRKPELSLLDFRAKIAANNVSRVRFLEMVQRYGLGTMLTLMDQVQSYSSTMIRAKLRDIPDGKWMAVSYVEGLKTPYLKVKVTVTKEGESLTIDFTGSSDQSPASDNVTMPTAIGGACDPFVAMLAYDVPWNQGIFEPIKFIFPPVGSVVNPVWPAATSCGTPQGALACVTAATQSALARMLLTSEKLRGDACGGINSSFIAPTISGRKADGSSFISVNLDGVAGGTGACPDGDGEDACQYIMLVKTMIVNVETNEKLFPYLYLARREVADTGGPGKYRGGVGQFMAITPYGIPQFTIGQVGMGQEPRVDVGISGGYPAANVQWGVIRPGNLREAYPELVKLPRNIEEIKGREVLPIKSFMNFHEGEVIYAFISGGGGGYGDPLERDPALVLQDVREGYVSLDAARETYGVVIDPRRMTVDEAGTRDRRGNIIRERLEQGTIRR